MKLKSLLITGAALVLAVGVQAQGFITMGNNGTTSPIYSSGTTKATSTTPIWIGLFVTTDLVTPVDTTQQADLSGWIFDSPGVRIGPIAGVFSGGTRTIEGVTGGTQVRAQIRIWSSAVGTTTFANDFAGYEAALATEGAFWAYMNIPNIMTLGSGSIPTPSLTAQGGIGPAVLEPVNVIPEPSILALGLLGGLGTLVLIRRRK